MIELVITLVAFIFLILFVAWLPYLRSIKNSDKREAEKNYRDETNVTLYHEHKAEIEKDFREGGIDEENYQYLLAELDKSLLQDIEENKKPDVNLAAGKPISMLWPSVISIFVIAFSFAIYSKNGAYQEIASTPRMSQEQAHQALDAEQQAVVRLKELRKMTEENPDDGDAWYSMGQTLIGVGQFDAAMVAFDQVIRVEGEHADIIGAKAQASYYKNNQQITAETQGLIDRALALDPLDASTNILLGMHNFINQNYQHAIAYWQKVVNAGRDNTNIPALEEAIAEAKNRLSLTGTTPSVETDAMTGPQLEIEVSLSADILEKLSQGEDKVVFVYAVPTEGKRMPVAAVKIKASDLPTTVVLNDALAMTGAAKLSDHDLVHLYAVVSNQGGAGIKPGDFKAERNGVAVKRDAPIALVIDSIVQ